MGAVSGWRGPLPVRGLRLRPVGLGWPALHRHDLPVHDGARLDPHLPVPIWVEGVNRHHSPRTDGVHEPAQRLGGGVAAATDELDTGLGGLGPGA